MELSRRRLREEPELDSDQPEARRFKPMPSFLSVIRGAMLAETVKGICLAMEPVFRKAVRDELQILISGPNTPYRNPNLHIEEVASIPRAPHLRIKNSPRQKLIFTNQPSLPIYTGNKITDRINNPLQIKLVNIATGEICKNSEGSPVKVQIVVIDGDFSDQEKFASDDFNGKIVNAREGKRPLLVGEQKDLIFTLNGGIANILGIYFTDNSSWIRSRKFRIGAKVVSESSNGSRIQEALTEKFTVKDHRGELYEKHFPPTLGDEVWRLKQIAKDGKYHERLESNGIKTVQDFLRSFVLNSDELKKILGMSKKSWDLTINHAKTCELGKDFYLLKFQGNEIQFNPIGEILQAVIGGQSYSRHEFTPNIKKIVQQLTDRAYQQWDQLERVSINLLPNVTEIHYNNSLESTINTGYRNGVELEMEYPPNSIGVNDFQIFTNIGFESDFGYSTGFLADSPLLFR